MNTTLSARPVLPWYCEPWPWLLMSGPFTAIIAGFFTLILAIESNDGLVADDYYKQGMAINQTMARDALAHELGYRAEMTFDRASGAVRISLSASKLPAEQLLLRLAHPTRSDMDQSIILSPLHRVENAAWNATQYTGRIAKLADARWKVMLQDRKNTWRISGELTPSGQPAITLRPGK